MLCHFRYLSNGVVWFVNWLCVAVAHALTALGCRLGRQETVVDTVKRHQLEATSGPFSRISGAVPSYKNDGRISVGEPPKAILLNRCAPGGRKVIVGHSHGLGLGFLGEVVKCGELTP